MSVKLIYNTPLDMITSGIRVCWQSQAKSDNGGPADLKLIDRIANKMKHSSVLRHSLYVFDITASTKTLLAFTRHGAGVEFGVESTRYTTSKQGLSISFTPTGNETIDNYNNQHLDNIQECIKQGFADDDIAMMLPQAYNYRWQVSMNAQAIQHFLKLRTSPGAHWDIRNVAFAIYYQLPKSHRFLFEDSLYKKEQ